MRCRLARHASVFLLCCARPAPTDIYTLSLHDALPISQPNILLTRIPRHVTHPILFEHIINEAPTATPPPEHAPSSPRSEEHTSELQSQSNLVCRLLLEKKK